MKDRQLFFRGDIKDVRRDEMAMMKEQKRSTEARSSRRWQLALWFGVIAIVLAATFLSSGSYLVQLSIQRWAQGAGVGELTIERVEFNPLIGTLVLHDVLLHKGGKQQLRLDEARIWMEWLPLWQRRLVAREITLRGFETALNRSSDGTLSLAGVNLGGDSSAAGEQEAWGVGLDALVLEQGLIQIVQDDRTTSFTLSRLELTDLSSWKQQQKAVLDFSGRFAQARFEIVGELQPFTDAPSASLKAKVNGLDLATLMSILNIKSPDIGGKFSITSGLDISYTAKAVIIAQRGSLGIEAFSLQHDDIRLRQKKMKWQGRMQLDYRMAEGLHIAASGDLGVFDSQMELDDGDIKVSLGALRIPSSEFDLSPKTVEWSQEGKLDLEQLHAIAHGTELKEEQISWNGRAAYENQLTVGEGVFELAGELNARSPTLALASEEMVLAADALQWRGEFKTSRKPSDGAEKSSRSTDIKGKLGAGQFRLSAFDGELNTSVANLMYEGELTQKEEVVGINYQIVSDRASLNVPGAHYRLLGWEHLETGVLRSTDLQQIELDQMTISGVRLAEMISDDPSRPPPLARAMSTRLEGMRYSADLGLSVEDVVVQDVMLDVRRDAQGAWSPKLVQERIKTALMGVDVGEQNQEKQPFSIKRLRVSGDSKLSFLDENIQPPYQETYQIEELLLSDLDSFSPMQPTALKGKVRIGTHSLIQLDAVLHPFKRRPDADVSLDVSALEIPPVSTYGEALLGYSLDSGQIDSQLSIKIKEEKLDGLVKLQIHQLQVSPLETERRKQFDTELSVPLETALDLLRNDQNSIKLELPIAGNLDNPDFDLRDAINQATGRALKKGAMTYLVASLQPFGALVMIASAVGDAASVVRLDPVVFEAGGLQWGESAVAYLSKVSQVLNERPELRVKICGVVVAEDRELLRQKKLTEVEEAVEEDKSVSTTDDELLRLAGARADKVKGYLVDQHKLKPGRLISCKATIETDEEQQPRVDLLL